MTHTYQKHLYHFVWSTKERKPYIIPEYQQRVFEYIGGAFRKADCVALQVGGVQDHIHALVAVPSKYAVSDVIRDVKICSSKWAVATLPDSQKFAWQDGFGSFTVSFSQKASVTRYILNQEKHHKKLTFKEEFIKFLKLNEIEFNEAYLWR